MTTHRNMLAAAQAAGRLEIVHVANTPSPTERTTEPAIHIPADPRAAPFQADKAVLMAALKEHAVATAEVDFEVSGDGKFQVNGIEAFNFDNAYVELDDATVRMTPGAEPTNLHTELTAFSKRVLSAFHPEFKADPGIYGFVGFELSAHAVTVHPHHAFKTVTSDVEV